MSKKSFNPSIVEEGLGAISIAACIASSPLLRPWYSRWGASVEEVNKPLPGDDQVERTTLQSTRAITIHASAADIWPWLVQMGQSRGGLYSYERLENLVGCDMHNACEILTAHQDLKVGDKVRIAKGDDVPYFVVTALETERAMILKGDTPPTTWGFVLEPIDDSTTRLLIRWRQDIDKTAGNFIMWRVFTDPITFVMERRLMLGIRDRAEAFASRS